MTLVTKEDLRKQLKDGEIKSVYLFFGAEDFLRDQAAKAITEKILKDAPLREFNEITMSLAQTDVQHAIAAAEQLPMIASRRVIKITEVNKIGREADEEALARYIMRPVETSVVLLLADDLDKRKKLTKTLIDNCTAVEFAPLGNDDLMRWARNCLKDLHAEADEKALSHLIALVGSDVRTLTNELGKIAVAALPSGKITFELVDELVPNSRELSNFELTDYLIVKNRRGALQILHKILDDGAEPLMLLGLIASNFHRLAWTKEAMARGADREEVFRVVRLPFNKREEFLATARRSDARSLTKTLERIARTDLAIKTSQGTPRLQIEMLVCELTR
ncbi:MAG: DNA polymerase III subunit delta [Pyrinomonadaceae bacterium]